MRQLVILFNIVVFSLLGWRVSSDALAGQGSSCLTLQEVDEVERVDDGLGDELDSDEAEIAPAPIDPFYNPFNYFGVREQILSHLDPADLRTFEKVNKACRVDAYKIDRLRWIRRWEKVGLHLLEGFSPEIYAFFGEGAKILRVNDFILSGRSRRRMKWSSALRFCSDFGVQMTREFNHPMGCEILDNSQWQVLIDASKNKSGEYDPSVIPQFRGKYWSKTPMGTSGAAQHTMDGRNGTFDCGFLLPRMLFLLRSKDVNFYARCACKPS